MHRPPHQPHQSQGPQRPVPGVPAGRSRGWQGTEPQHRRHPYEEPPPPPPRKSGSTKIIALLAGIAVVSLVTVSVLVIRGEEPPPPKQIRTSETAAASGVPSPNAAETRALLDGLRDIREDLATRRSVALAVDMCEEMLVGRDDVEEYPEYIADSPVLLEKTRQRFGAERKVNKTQAGRILRLIHGTFCR